MLEILFHMSFAFFILAGVLYFSIFSWLKMQQSGIGTEDQSNVLEHNLKTDLANPFAVHTDGRIYF